MIVLNVNIVENKNLEIVFEDGQTLLLNPLLLWGNPELRRIPFAIVRNNGQFSTTVKDWFKEVLNWTLEVY